jgi:peroxiredoxin
MRLQIGDNAPNMSLLNMQDTTVLLADVWQPHGLIISFLRHFG